MALPIIQPILEILAAIAKQVPSAPVRAKKAWLKWKKEALKKYSRTKETKEPIN